jgi:uncharacterized protein DUF6498
VDRLVAWYRVGSSVGAVVALIVANAIPLIGVLFFGWNVWTILIVYWVENGVVGAFNVLKMVTAEGVPGDTSAQWRMNGRPVNDLSRVALVPFFVIHYGMFWVVHGIFVFLLPVFALSADGSPNSVIEGFEPWAIPLAIIALTISHGLSFWFNFWKGGEYQRVSAASLMFAPYGRLVILHITIIVGGLAIAITGAPASVVAILVLLKTAVDLGFHLNEHRRLAVPMEATIG